MANDATSGKVYTAIKTPGYRLADFRRDWEQMPEQDKDQMRAGVADGTLTYPDPA